MAEKSETVSRTVALGAYQRLETHGEVLHPLVAHVRRRLEALTAIVDLEAGGKPVAIDAFRLRNLPAWAVDPSGHLLDNMGALSGYCNARCTFCYEYGNPLPYDLTMLGLEESRTRARYYDPDRRKGLLQFRTRLDLEPFTNPRLLDILAEFRRHDATHVISLTTNGARLSDEMIDGLAQLAPVHLVLSVNNADPEGRKTLMRDGRPDVAISAGARLRQRGIPFTGGIVAWPETSDVDLRRTIRFYDTLGARAIRVSMPSYSGFFSGDVTLFDTDMEWDRVFSLVEEEADQIDTPISAAPYLPRGIPIVPRVAGVIRNSPAARAGIRRGDILMTVNGHALRSRMHAKRLLREEGVRSQGVVQVTLSRGDETQNFTLDDRSSPNDDLYPYKPAGYLAPSAGDESYGSLFGLFLNDDLDPDDLLTAVDRAHARGAKTVVILTSKLVEGVVARYYTENPTLAAASADLDLIIVSPRHAFWGGNITVGDLYLCQDYIACLERVAARLGRPPDLALIPCTFSPNHWTDLAGVPYSEIELRTGVPVELVPCRRIVV